MADTKISTRQLLLETAGELFAVHGFAATSVKMIAQKSGQNIAAVNYHFGSKQNLFNESLKYVLEKIMTPREPLGSEVPAEIETKLMQYLDERVKFLLSSQTPQWYGQLIVRAVLNTPSGLEQESIAILSPDFDFLENLAQCYDPTLDQATARRWAYSVVGMVFFYVLGRNMILYVNGLSAYSQAYIEAVAKQVKEFACLWLRHRKEIVQS